MAYNPGTHYRGEAYLFQAISNLGQSAGKALETYREDRQEDQFLEQELQGLLQSGQRLAPLIQVQDPEVAATIERNVSDLGKFAGLSLAQKRAKVAQMGFELDALFKTAAASSWVNT
jgi:hypothetical protein